MTSSGILDAFTATKDTLHDAGLDDDFFTDLVASRLLVERVGESSNLDWWESRVLSETGRARLSEVTPNTRLKSRIELASKVGRKVESDRLPDDSISLFSFGPQVESRLSAAIDDMDSPDDLSFEALENLSVESLDDGWTHSVIDATASNVSAPTEAEAHSAGGSGGTLELDDSGYTLDEIEPEKWSLLATLLQGYGSNTDQLIVPYYPLESELKSENAG